MTDPEQRDDVDRYHDIEARKRGVPKQAGDLADLQSVTPPTWGPGMTLSMPSRPDTISKRPDVTN